MRINKRKILEKLKNNLFNFIYLLLLIVLLAFMLNKEKTTNDDAQTLTKKDQLVDENKKHINHSQNIKKEKNEKCEKHNQTRFRSNFICLICICFWTV